MHFGLGSTAFLYTMRNKESIYDMPLKTSSKTPYLTRSTNPAKRVRAWAHRGRWPFSALHILEKDLFPM